MAFSDIKTGHPTLRATDRRKNSRLMLVEEYEKMIFGLETAEADVIRYLLSELPAKIPTPKDSESRIIDRIRKTLGKQYLRLKMDEGNRRELIYSSFEKATEEWGKKAQYANGRHFGSWWANCLAYQCRNWYTLRKNRMVSVASRSESKSESAGLDMAAFANDACTVDDISPTERAEIVAKGLKALSDAGLSEIWSLHASGMMGTEIAKHLDLHAPQVSVRLNRARDILRGCLG
jgi:DNA-directed RNA polymerase specialized sigma24 family protein